MSDQPITKRDIDSYVATFFVESPDSEPKTIICGPRFHAFITGKFDPETRRNRFAGNAHQKRKMRRYQDRMWAKIGSFEKPPAKLQPDRLRGLAGLIDARSATAEKGATNAS